ncbi:MAG TPA: NAD-dependent epimerase/dehydratase family protein [Bacteroidales bacterium]|nr:NAD-dependent epimerase/dehydratase family protein [Bacteroidales bacterium]
MKKILVIGAAGQIGTDLTSELRNRFGANNVVASDIKLAPDEVMQSGPFVKLDAMDKKKLEQVIDEYGINEIYHLAAILSGNAEKNPKWAWDLNMNSLFNVLDVSKAKGISRIFWPSSMGAFGPTTPEWDTPQTTVMEPTTVYGISKLAGERWVEYYHEKYNMDIRSLRYPGLISYKTEAGGGTTDYAVEIFYQAIKCGKYECFLSEDMALPMMFMDDAVEATIQLMEAPSEKIRVRSSYNLGGISFTPKELADEIRKYIPELEVTYKPDFRQQIAESWPRRISDEAAQKDWGWQQQYDLQKMTSVMIEQIRKKMGK